MNNPLDPKFTSSVGTTSLDLPPALASILSVGSTMPSPSKTMMQPQAAGLTSGMIGPQTFSQAFDNPSGAQGFVPSYQQGGMIGTDGMPIPPGQASMPNMSPAQGIGVNSTMPQQGQLDPKMIDMQIQEFVSQNPQQVAQINQALVEMIQAGEVTTQQVNMTAQLLSAAMQNPSLYPYVRKYAIQQGLVDEEDLPQQFDAGLIIAFIIAARSFQQGANDMVAVPQQTNVPSMKYGGEIPNSKKADGSVLINAHEGEYVIPKAVVEMKGKEFFDNLVQKYST